MDDDEVGLSGDRLGVTIDEHVGSRLQKIRVAHGLAAKTLCRALGITPSELAAWEAGRRRVPAHALLELSQLLSCPLIAFFAEFPLGEGQGEDADGSEGYVNAIFNRYPDFRH